MTIVIDKFTVFSAALLLLVTVGCEQPTPPKPVEKAEVVIEETVVMEPEEAKLDKQAPVDEQTPVTDKEQIPAKDIPQPEDGPADATSRDAGKPATEVVMLGSPELTAGIPGTGPLKLEEIKTWLADPKNHAVLSVKLPLGLDAGASQIKGLDKNPLTRAKIELGRQLYFDTRLSADNTISCASCHHPEEGFAKHTQFGVGIGDQQGGRNSPASYNRILSDLQFWDGRALSLEDQAVGPIANAIEMGNTHEACVAAIKKVPGYELQFNKIFGDLNINAVGQALAAFERTLVTGPTPFDYAERFKPMASLDADDLKEDDPDLYAKYEAALADVNAHPMSDSAKRGQEIFFGAKGNCTACHVGPNLTDELYHNIGVGMDAEKPDIGRKEISNDTAHHGAFKTPTIRNVALTAPYMHDGSQATLAEVVEWYNKGGHANPHLSDKIKKLNLTDQDKADLVAFMEACTGEFPKVETNRLPE